MRFLRSCILHLKSYTEFKLYSTSTTNGIKNRRYKNVTDEFVKKLCSIIGEDNVSTSLAVREQCGTDEGYHGTFPSDVVVFPHSRDQISEIAKLCSSFWVPMIPRGTGTGLELGVGAIMGGVCVDLRHMTSILEVNDEDFDCTVEAGVTRKSLNHHIKDTGLMFPIDPGADASLGGMASTSASGTNAVRYGTMKENVLNLEVVLADGSVLHTAGPNRRTRKSAAGYNLTELFVGSEGTLGIISKVTLRLHAVPQMMVSAICSFPTIQNAVQTVVHILQSSIPLARIELLDEISMGISCSYSKLDYPIAPSLFLEFHGNEESTKAQAKEVEEIVKMNDGSNFIWSANAEERNKLWKARHDIYYATLAQKPGYKSVVTDVCVPISKLTEIIVKTKEDIMNSGLYGTVVGHVGDGNFHTQLLYDPENKKEFAIAHELENKISQRALSLNGTCTGEHGIGVGKMSFLQEELGEVGIRTMRFLKQALDPQNLMNPGKVIKLQ
ncbi:putative D-lactate dehydrogenase, mitochondrial [Araneus ventricosus]|uniref:Probable D-lactate dehydrogenase, mitochondrial n=1 Tax=Araneus ventricosus TaxID=182803 RepID=A0A4Y2GQE4_ARAVE|nr:putative D-lactate dehydrogenase, mitochondrial [Araneus ventricosus]